MTRSSVVIRASQKMRAARTAIAKQASVRMGVALNADMVKPHKKKSAAAQMTAGTALNKNDASTETAAACTVNAETLNDALKHNYAHNSAFTARPKNSADCLQTSVEKSLSPLMVLITA